MRTPILTMEIHFEHDVVQTRQRARQIAGLLGFDPQDQTRLATAVSEIARNAFSYGGGGKIEFFLDQDKEQQRFVIRVTDRGPGIADLQAVLDGAYISSTGMGLGIIGAKRLMDRFEIETRPGMGTSVVFDKMLPARSMRISKARIAEIGEELARRGSSDPFAELQQQNQELMRALDALRGRQEELATLNQELEDTNRGVVALYAELDERADYLQRANEVKTRFLSNMTHEFRTPLNSILSLSRLLLDRIDGQLTPEQEKQVQFIRSSAQALSELVNDLLDLAKVEAGKITIKPDEFNVEDLFGALRGMLKPLLAANSAVNLVFEDATGVGRLETDEGKVSQILRNFISNALKFTQRGDVRVSARRGPDDTVVFAVSDTGIGIAEADQERIFEEFTQLETPLQKQLKGTGLGLPLSRKLAHLLGGDITLKSEPGKGSVFSATIPRIYKGPDEAPYLPAGTPTLIPGRVPVLLIEDNPEAVFIYNKFLRDTPFQSIPVRSVKEARHFLKRLRPAAVITDILLEGESAWNFISELREAAIPAIVITVVDNEKKALALGAAAFHVKPVTRDWLVSCLEEATGQRAKQTLLVIDDDDISRYLTRGLLPADRYRIEEATSGAEGIRLARTTRPAAIFLDLLMPDMNGFETLDQLKTDPETQAIPVIINTAKRVDRADHERLRDKVVAVLSKESGGTSREDALAAMQQALARALSVKGDSAHHA